jgi:hypothetical protein
MSARTFSRAALLAACVVVAAAAPARADVVVADDNVVQGSLCAGLDCVDGEPFGPDTLRLKENNTRLVFSDTSTAPGAPATSWEITANDTASGGQSYLGVLDVNSGLRGLRALAGSPADTLVLAPGGLVRLTRGPLLQRVNAAGTENAAALDGGALLSALRTLPISTYHGTGDPSGARHIGPSAAAFNAAFGLGSGDEVAVNDLAGVALASAGRLATGVAAASPGARGPAGPAGAGGSRGPAGDRGPAGAPNADHTPSDAALNAFVARLRKLARSEIVVRGRTVTLRRHVASMTPTR